MSGKRGSLAIPEKKDVKDPGAHELESESDEHFSDAQSAQSRGDQSPIPKTRVEKVDDEPSYGEVPGTEAYRMREGDAEPDEIAIIPDKDKNKNKNKPGAEGESVDLGGIPDEVPAEVVERIAVGEGFPPSTPSGEQSVPKTVVEQTEDAEGAQAAPEKKHRADPPPDLVVKGGADSGADSPLSPAVKTPRSARSKRKPSIPTPDDAQPDDDDDADADEEADDFGDDFDDFEEGAEGEDDDDFGDFDDGFEAPTAAAPTPAPPQPPAIQPLSFPIPDFEDLDADDILSMTEPYLNALYPPDDEDAIPSFPPLSKDNPVFLTPRSASLWSQLVAPPPLQPPDWIRSRIRRLFLVSLGVPVDLDEILPASKQKKLVLPSLAVPRSDSRRTSTDSRVARLRADGDNASTTSVDTQGKPKEKSSSRSKSAAAKKGTPSPPDLDLVAAKQLCTTTDEALDGMTDGELKAHLEKLRSLELATGGVLEYWKKRADEKIGDRETFEGVIENLVKHARKVRK